MKKINKFFITSFLLLFVITNIHTQKKDTISIGEHRKTMAITQIKELKKGVLLVQLKTKQNTINAYLKKGLEEKANKIKDKQLKDNITIIKGFNNNFNFCPVYFYLSSDYNNIINKNYKNIVFYDSLMKPIEIKHNLEKTNYYVCEISKNDFKNTTLNNIPNYNIKYNNSTKFDAFIIKNNKFQQLSSPFPYYSKTHTATRIKNKKREESIKKLNYKLHVFYKNTP